VWLALLAAGNVILWAGVALVVAFVASDRLDLGIESTVREYEATAVASWSSPIESRTPAGLTSSQVPSPILSPAALGPAIEPTAGATEIALLPSPTAPAERDLASGESKSGGETSGNPTAPPTPQIIPSDPTPIRAAAQFEPASPLTTPLLLTDPRFSDLASLDPEIKRSAAGRTVQIRYQEAALNRELAAWLATRPDLPYRSVYVDLRDGQVVVTCKVVVLSFLISAEVEGELVASNCRPELELSSVKIGGLFTPGFARDEVKKMLDQALDWYPSDYLLCIDEIVLQDDGTTVYGHRR
jgi:hypothetical protein